MTETILEPLLDYEDYCEDGRLDANIKPRESHKVREKRFTKKKKPRPNQSGGAFSFEKLISEKISEIREDVSRAQRRAMKNRDISITKLREEVHTDVKNSRKDKRSRLLNRHRQMHREEWLNVQQDEDLESIFALVWGFSKLTCLTKANGNQRGPINVKKRKTASIDFVSYYDIPERKIIKLI